MLMESLSVNELAKRLLESLPATVRGAQADLENNFRIVLRHTLGKLDLVTREEFEVQTKVLERSRARLAVLEARLAELEQAHLRSSGSA
jgi:ubiquinone biosynthesis accessory factor UbiK